jgi:hypothetical protein
MKGRPGPVADPGVPYGVEAIFTLMGPGLCARCGAPAEHVHHWAPRELFEDAEQWPTSELCGDCHRLWHMTINAERRRRHGSLGRR